MKSFFSALLLLCSLTAFAQESFRKEYILKDLVIFEGTGIDTLKSNMGISRANLIPAGNAVTLKLNDQVISRSGALTVLSGEIVNTKDSITIKRGAIVRSQDVLLLQKEVSTKFAKLPPAVRDSLVAVYPLNSTLSYTVERNLPPGKVIVSEKIKVDKAFQEALAVKKVTSLIKLPASRGFVKFEEDKVWVNPNLVNFESDGPYYYQLKNRQSLVLEFREFTVSALTLPLKYRFGKEDVGVKNITEDFTTGINFNLFLGWTRWGSTTFHYREKVSNITNTQKITPGLLFGASTVTLNASNTSAAAEPITAGTDIVTGLASVGGGVTYSFNKINLGAFVGADYSLGNSSRKWNYRGRPWVGLAVGYSLFAF
jgi:hypothetical protein